MRKEEQEEIRTPEFTNCARPIERIALHANSVSQILPLIVLGTLVLIVASMYWARQVLIPVEAQYVCAVTSHGLMLLRIISIYWKVPSFWICS